METNAEILKVEGISKIYGGNGFLCWKKNNRKAFQALQHVSFSINKGETLGIIGKNGAGKSTLLKIISGMIRPSKGAVTGSKSKAALLDTFGVFKWQLSGKENAKLIALSHGISLQTLNAALDEIATFSELGEKFQEPVNTYSSGMRLRLAFATLVHLPFEIYIFDEVFEVGDFFFQQKIQPKIAALKEKGCAFVLVSHDLMQITSFCDKLMLLENGECKQFGKVNEVLSQYVDHASVEKKNKPNQSKIFFPALQAKGLWNLIAVHVKAHDEGVLWNDLPVDISINFENICGKWLFPSIRINDNLRKALLYTSPLMYEKQLENFDVHGLQEIGFQLPEKFLKPGSYTIDIVLVDENNQGIHQFINVSSLQIAAKSRNQQEVLEAIPISILPNFLWQKKQSVPLRLPEFKTENITNHFLDKIFANELDGIIIRGFMQHDDALKAAKKVMDSPFEKSKSYWFGRLHGVNLMLQGMESNTGIDYYFEDYEGLYDWINDMIGCNYLDKIQEFLSTGTGGKVLEVSNLIGKPYKSIGIREFVAHSGGLHIHIENEYGVGVPPHAELEKYVDLNKQISHFVILEQAEIGGHLRLFELRWDDNLTKTLVGKSQYQAFDEMKKNRNDLFSKIPSEKIQLNPGDLIVFNAGGIWHAVENIEAGKRITLGGFLAPSFTNDNYYMWF